MPKQDVAVELYYDDAWHDIASDDDVFADQPIVITRGQGDESAAPRPAGISMRLANDDDKYRTSNPESPLYGKAGLNTPTRVSVGGSVRGSVEASSWSADQNRDFRRTPGRGKAWVDFRGGGLLQRIAQWSEEFRSPLQRSNSALGSLTGYWSMEREPEEATLLPGVAGSRTGTVRYVTAPSNDYPRGSEPLLKIGSQGFMEGYFARSGRTADGWQLSWAMRLPVQPDGSTAITPMEWELADGSTGSVQWVGTDIYVFTFGPTGAGQLNVIINGAGTDWTKWNLLQLRTSISGGTVSGGFSWYTEGASSSVGVTDTYSDSTTSELSRWFVGVAAGGENAGTAYGHVLGTIGVLDDLGSSDRLASFNGFAGETAGARFIRLMSEIGLAYALRGVDEDSTPMGPQRPDTLPNLLREIVTTEDGLLFDEIDSLVVVFTTRSDRYQQTPALTLGVNDLPFLPREVVDDLNPKNVVTASQRNGGEYTARDDTGRLGTQPPPDGVGEYRQTVDVNLDDVSALQQVANWWLRKGTVDLPRYPQVTLDLNAVPSLVEAAEAVDVGHVIEIVGFRENTVRLRVLGYTETIGTHSRKIVFTCAPDQQFVTGEYGDGLARYDSGSTTLKTTALKFATALTFRTVDANELWSTTSTPYDVVIAGQRSQVTSMGAASLVSGAYDQAATVIRGVDGVVKELPAGSEIHIATPGRWAL